MFFNHASAVSDSAVHHILNARDPEIVLKVKEQIVGGKPYPLVKIPGHPIILHPGFQEVIGSQPVGEKCGCGAWASAIRQCGEQKLVIPSWRCA
ncbi:MAG: hypothetical protein R3F31_20375 [Verrucomicrobiales bacterium]